MSAASMGRRLQQQVLHDEPMSAHTSWKIGGPADQFYRPASIEDLTAFLASVGADTEIHWVGLGSNLLVRDGGIRGAVVCTLDLPARIERMDARRVRVGAGVPCTVLARQCVRWQLGPAAFFAGIPGTFGGALAMNAGAFGGETWDGIETLETIDRGGVLRTREAAEYEVGYRSVVGPAGEWFLAATLALEPDSEADMSDITSMLRERDSTQPLGQRSCGSVFRNPPGEFAARLIEAAGLKGRRVGGAVVSEKHANFIINTGTATAEDVERLIEEVREGVEADCGISLELEVRILGERRHAG